tara:strand:- start:3104 stop:4027 length:924 start_codon:yes stop_codon:yes gene_type:complete
MNKLKLYVYPNAKGHVHDQNPKYVNCIPLSKKGLEDHCELVGPEEADYFYMGQFADVNNRPTPDEFQYFEGNEERHIVDLEGEGGILIPEWLHGSIITTNGPLKEYSHIKKLFVRPTFSHLLLDIVNGEPESFDLPEEKTFGFKGLPNHAVRYLLFNTFYQSNKAPSLPVQLIPNNVWGGPKDSGDELRKEYVDMMLQHSLSLCPRGIGIDSVRVIESCYYNRAPIIISDKDYGQVGEYKFKVEDYAYKVIVPDLSETTLIEKLTEIYETPMEQLKEKSNNAKRYFDTVIRDYFADPTKEFIEWLHG